MGIVDKVVDWVRSLYFVKKAARKKIRQEIRGYRLLRRSADSGRVNKLNQVLTQLNLKLDCPPLYAFIFGKEAEMAEIAVRQSLLLRLAGRRLNGAILQSIASSQGPISAALPGIWIQKLLQSGLNVNKSKSRVLFGIFIFRCFGRGVARILWDFAGIRGFSPLQKQQKYVQFLDLTPNNLPKLESGERYDIVSWYMGWSGRVEGLREVRHTVPFQVDREIEGRFAIQYYKYMLPRLVGIKSTLRYSLWGVGAIFYAIWEMFYGRWTCAVLLEDMAIAKKVALADASCLAEEYMFNQSSTIFRPLWTYVAERLGSRITLYCYAGSIPFQYKGNVPYYEIGFQSMTWPRLLQFSAQQQAYSMAACSPSVKVELVPPIYFSDCSAALPKVSRPCIAVFDVTPMRTSYRASLIPEDDFRTLEVGIRFLEEIYDVLVSHGYSMMWKRKRSYTNRVHSKGYIKYADSFARRPGVVEVHPDIAAERVIRNCFAAISMPFTSTGLLAKYANTASVFYDPVGSLSPDDQASLGVPLIVGAFDLKQWVAGLTRPIESADDGLKN
jgi:polysaccharide biosynthesis PFTS motif protein